jgi:hypothetical protein
MSDVDGDGIPSTQSDRSILQEYLDGSRDYLPGWWNRLRTRDEKAAWISQMLAIDGTERHIYIANVWDCNEFALQLHLNCWGYETILPGYDAGIPSKYVRDHLGRFNLPVYWALLEPKTGEAGHSVNAVLIGADPTRIFNWLIIDPQTDSTSVGPPGRNMDLLIAGILRFGNPHEVVPYAILGFNIDLNGTGSLIRMESPLILPRPELVMARDNTPPVLEIRYPRPVEYAYRVSELRYVLQDDSPCRMFYSVDGGMTRIGPVWEAGTAELQAQAGANTWIVYAKDVFGNAAGESVTFRINPDSTSR